MHPCFSSLLDFELHLRVHVHEEMYYLQSCTCTYIQYILLHVCA